MTLQSLSSNYIFEHVAAPFLTSCLFRGYEEVAVCEKILKKHKIIINKPNNQLQPLAGKCLAAS